MGWSTEGNFVTTLECNHVVTTKYMNPGSEHYCLRCQKIKRSLHSLKKYTWRCQSCLMARSYIATRLRAEGYAMKHHRTFRSHHVILTDIDGKVLWDSHPNTNRQAPLF